MSAGETGHSMATSSGHGDGEAVEDDDRWRSTIEIMDVASRYTRSGRVPLFGEDHVIPDEAPGAPGEKGAVSGPSL